MCAPLKLGLPSLCGHLPQMNSFSWSTDEPAFVFAEALGHYPKYVWEAVSTRGAAAAHGLGPLPCLHAARERRSTGTGWLLGEPPCMRPLPRSADSRACVRRRATRSAVSGGAATGRWPPSPLPPLPLSPFPLPVVCWPLVGYGLR
jgi:hypothetical protein